MARHPRPPLVDPRRPVPERPAGHRGQHDRERRPADAEPRARRHDQPAAVGRRRLHPRLRRAAAGGRQPRRSARPPPGPAGRSRLLRPDLARGVVRVDRRPADRAPRGDGCERGADLPGHAGAAQLDLHRPPRAGRTAIGIWSGVSGLAVALGPVSGGLLLEHFCWGSVFFVNVPLAVVALLAGLRLLPESRHAHPGRFDPVGAFARRRRDLLVWTMIEAPDNGWASARDVGGFAGRGRGVGRLRRLGAAPPGPAVRRAPVPQRALLGRERRRSRSRSSACSASSS